MDDMHAFKYEFIWDPLTGEKLEKDPYGPLYYDPDYLIKYFYTSRLNKLYAGETEDNSGYYQGYYDDGVGCGQDFFLSGRGHHPEWYVFRLPNMDCYNQVGQSYQLITFGPRLSDDEIIEIYEKACLEPDRYKKIFGTERPDLIEMKKLYDNAIAIEPKIKLYKLTSCTCDQCNNKNELTQDEINAKENRLSVDKLRKMKG